MEECIRRLCLEKEMCSAEMWGSKKKAPGNDAAMASAGQWVEAESQDVVGGVQYSRAPR